MKILISLDKDKHPNNNNLLLMKSECTGYFKSREHEIAFYFKTNSSIFDKYLGIKKIHMIDKSKAKELKNSYLRLFHPDRKKGINTDLDYDDVCADINATFHRISGGKI